MIEMSSVAKCSANSMQIPDRARQFMIPFSSGLSKPQMGIAAFRFRTIAKRDFENFFLTLRVDRKSFPVGSDDLVSDFQRSHGNETMWSQNFCVKRLCFPHTLASVDHDARRPVLAAGLDCFKHSHSMFLLIVSCFLLLPGADFPSRRLFRKHISQSAPGAPVLHTGFPGIRGFPAQSLWRPF